MVQREYGGFQFRIMVGLSSEDFSLGHRSVVVRKISLLIAGRLRHRGFHFWLRFSWDSEDFSLGCSLAAVRRISFVAVGRLRLG